VRYSQPRPRDQLGRDYDAAGRLTAEELIALGVPTDADVRLCGPSPFASELTAGLVAYGVARERIHSESFGGAPAAVHAGARASVPVGDDAAVVFCRSGVTAAWSPGSTSLLELAEANAVPASSGCRVGACHGCATRVMAGSVRHSPEPLQPPPPGSALLCCAVPEGDVVLDA